MFEAVLGVPRAGLFSAYDIMGIPLVDARARFVLPVGFGAAVEIVSEVTEFRRSSFDVGHRMFLAGELAVEGRETRVWATRDKVDPSRIKSKPVPADVIARFRGP
jgi:4-hydroxybenzoyl-CoA thioesterase